VLMDFITFLGVLLGWGYLLITLTLKNAWQTIPKINTPTDFLPQTRLSIIVAAKNESDNIGLLVDHLLAQNYPQGLVEFIIVNDHSIDDTLVQIAQIDLPNNFNVLNAKEHAGKKAAVSQGIAFAKGELIVTTDADCTMGTQWLRSIAWLYETQQPEFISSPVVFYQENSFLERFQSLDFLGMMLITGAGIQKQKFYMANGANMAFKKTTFEAVSGYEGNEQIASGDDMFLVSKVAQQFPKGSILYNMNPDGVVRTKAESTLTGFIRQRIRWGSKNTASDDWVLKLILGWVFFTSVWLVFFIWTKYWLLILLLKLVGDFFLLRVASEYFERKDLMRFFLPSFLVHTLYIVGIGFGSLVWKKVKWK